MTNGAAKCTLFITTACKARHSALKKEEKNPVPITMVNLVRPVTTFSLTQAIFTLVFPLLSKRSICCKCEAATFSHL